MPIKMYLTHNHLSLSLSKFSIKEMMFFLSKIYRGWREMPTTIFWKNKNNTVIDLITAPCTYVFQNFLVTYGKIKVIYNFVKRLTKK